MAATEYRGRFAPSPTGPLHFGSLLAALASFLDARHHGGAWLLRMEDIDPPREAPGARESILNCLQRHGLCWDGAVTYQSSRSNAYEETLEHLQRQQQTFRCSCTRAVLGPGGSCGGRCTPGPDDSTSLRTAFQGTVSWEDVIKGRQQQALPPDQVLKRKDGLYAYALAVVVDDWQQGISHVLRGEDLLDQTAPQIRLHERLGSTPPAFGHIPVLRDDRDCKLSKQTGAEALNDDQALTNLRLALRYLGQGETHGDTVPTLLESAVARWNRDAVAEAGRRPLRYPPPVSH